MCVYVREGPHSLLVVQLLKWPREILKEGDVQGELHDVAREDDGRDAKDSDVEWNAVSCHKDLLQHYLLCTNEPLHLPLYPQDTPGDVVLMPDGSVDGRMP